MSLELRIARSALRGPAANHRYGPGPSQVGDLHLPRGDGPFPVAVLLHGGFWQTRYGKVIMRPLAEDLTRHGWAAWNLEYRRLGRGRAGGGGWPRTFDDVAAGIDLLAQLDHPWLDLRDGVTAVGHSAGGHLALWAAARPAPRVPVRDVVALAAVTDLARSGAVARRLMGGTPDELPERYALADPIRQVPLPVPVLLVHPRDDATVPVERSRAYAAQARAHGAPVELVEPAGGGHRAPIDPSTDAWAAVLRYLRPG